MTYKSWLSTLPVKQSCVTEECIVQVLLVCHDSGICLGMNALYEGPSLDKEHTGMSA